MKKKGREGIAFGFFGFFFTFFFSSFFFGYSRAQPPRRECIICLSDCRLRVPGEVFTPIGETIVRPQRTSSLFHRGSKSSPTFFQINQTTLFLPPSNNLRVC